MKGNSFPRWKFRKMDKSEKLQDPIQSQFFTTNIVGGLTAALVRETIQNSLDAKTSDDDGIKYSVLVRFSLSGLKNAIIPKKVNYYLTSLIPHIKAKDNGILDTKVPDFSQPMPYLVIEDRNTIGLVGDPLEYDDPPENDKKKHNFFWFWRNVGRSGKQHDARGRWGLGKAVYPKSSDIHTYFGLTARELEGTEDSKGLRDQNTLLMGESILKIHKIEGQSENIYPYGYYGAFIDPEDEYFVSPFYEKEDIDSFIYDFRLLRKNEEGKYLIGLSLVIPYPSEEITRSELIKATVIQYFYPIILDQLSVSVEDENTEKPIEIDSKSINEVINEIDFKEEDAINHKQLNKLIDFSRWIIEIGDDDIIVLLEPDDEYSTPGWYTERLLNNEIRESLNKKIDAFDKGERVGFKVPVIVHAEGKNRKIAWFKVFMEKDEELKEPDCHFIRDGITIVGVRPIRKKDIRAVVIVEDPILSKLLGDAENPAHTEWSKDSPNFIGKYVNGDKVLSFVINSLDRLYGWLIKPAEGLDEDILKDFFYIDLPENEDKSKGKGKTEDDRETTGIPNPPDGERLSHLL